MTPTRRFEYSSPDENSDKFWSIYVVGTSFTTCWGRRGAQGQSGVKTFSTPEKAAAEAEKLIAEKVRKGYREVGRAAPQAATQTAASTWWGVDK
jgi:predicted DNA-binding WGR domain protein